MTSAEKKLLENFQALGEDDQRSLLSFAEFLHSKKPGESKLPSKPLDIPPPENESVVGAIKRLKKTYPMIESTAVLDKASGLLSSHLLQGRNKESVIQELEILFQGQYEAMKNEKMK